MKRIFLFTIPMLTLLPGCDSRPDYDATGLFEATTVTVSAETPGKIVMFDIEEGDSVSAGQTVALVDTTMLSLQRKQLRSQQQATEKSSPDIAAQAASLRNSIAHQERECERQKALLADGATTRKQYDDAMSQLTSLQAQLEALLSTLSKTRGSASDNALALQYRIEEIGENILRSLITAPTSGTVLTKYAEAGEYTTPGRPLFRIADLDNIYLRCYFSSSLMPEVSIGREVTVIADFGGGERYEYPGTITWISQECEFTPKSIQAEDSRANLVYAVKVAVKNDGRLKLGQYGEVRL